jgi:hypothetical protein
MVITKTHNVNANNALELWHEATYSINHKVMNEFFKDLEKFTARDIALNQRQIKKLTIKVPKNAICNKPLLILAKGFF